PLGGARRPRGGRHRPKGGDTKNGIAALHGLLQWGTPPHRCTMENPMGDQAETGVAQRKLHTCSRRQGSWPEVGALIAPSSVIPRPSFERRRSEKTGELVCS